MPQKEDIGTGMSLLQEFQNKFSIVFTDTSLLEKSLTHSSVISNSNETLEFLGDTILSFIVSKYLFLNSEENEGYLTKAKSKLVAGSALARIAKKIHIDKHILLAKGVKANESILAGAYEALIAAIYLDQGIEKTEHFIKKTLLKEAGKILKEKDHKSLLQEQCLKEYGVYPIYKVVSEQGPPHNRIFEIELWIGDKLYGKGRGYSKQEAEKEAAKEAYMKLGVKS